MWESASVSPVECHGCCAGLTRPAAPANSSQESSRPRSTGRGRTASPAHLAGLIDRQSNRVRPLCAAYLPVDDGGRATGPDPMLSSDSANDTPGSGRRPPSEPSAKHCLRSRPQASEPANVSSGSSSLLVHLERCAPRQAGRLKSLHQRRRPGVAADGLESMRGRHAAGRCRGKPREISESLRSATRGADAPAGPPRRGDPEAGRCTRHSRGAAPGNFGEPASRLTRCRPQVICPGR